MLWKELLHSHLFSPPFHPRPLFRPKRPQERLISIYLPSFLPSSFRTSIFPPPRAMEFPRGRRSTEAAAGRTAAVGGRGDSSSRLHDVSCARVAAAHPIVVRVLRQFWGTRYPPNSFHVHFTSPRLGLGLDRGLFSAGQAFVALQLQVVLWFLSGFWFATKSRSTAVTAQYPH